MIRFEFFVHSTVPHSQAVAERLRSQLAQEQGVASSPTAPILLGDVYAAVLQMIRDATAKGASSIATSLHHTVYATAVLLPLAQRPPSTVAASSSQLGGHHVPMRPPIVLPNSDTMLRSTKTCETEDSGTRESTCSVGHIDRTLAAFCRPLLGNVHTSCGSPFHVRIGITVASKRSEAANDDPSAKKAYKAPTINDETLAAAAEYRRQQNKFTAKKEEVVRNVWTGFPLRTMASGVHAGMIAYAMGNSLRVVLLARQYQFDLTGFTAADGSDVAIHRGALETVSALQESQFLTLATLFRIGASLQMDGSFGDDDVEPSGVEHPDFQTLWLHRILFRAFIGSD